MYEIPPHNALLNDWESIYFSENVRYSPADPTYLKQDLLIPRVAVGFSTGND